jgi:hypothetical protein
MWENQITETLPTRSILNELVTEPEKVLHVFAFDFTKPVPTV